MSCNILISAVIIPWKALNYLVKCGDILWMCRVPLPIHFWHISHADVGCIDNDLILQTAHQNGEDEISLSTLGRVYTIDFNSMQQINEDTGTARGIQRKPNPLVSPNSGSANSRKFTKLSFFVGDCTGKCQTRTLCLQGVTRRFVAKMHGLIWWRRTQSWQSALLKHYSESCMRCTAHLLALLSDTSALEPSSGSFTLLMQSCWRMCWGTMLCPGMGPDNNGQQSTPKRDLNVVFYYESMKQKDYCWRSWMTFF